MSTDVIAPTSSVKEQSEPVTQMDTSTTDVESTSVTAPVPEETPVNGEQETSETKTGKRKRSTKKPVETEETNISNGRPRRTLPKREEPTPVTITNGTSRASKTKVEQTGADADDEQERDKNIAIAHDVADVVWVKMGGHPWWPSLIIRDPNDSTRCFTKITGNARAKRMYFVVFYGSTADFAWVPDAAIISYEGVEAFTKYAQETVDKAQTKSQKEQLTERFQLKVTISRREDWEMAVREADEALKQTSETRLEEIEPKIQFYTSKIGTPKGQPGRKPKASVTKSEELSDPSSVDPNDRSGLVDKAFDFKSDDESSPDESPVRKAPLVKIKLKKQTSDNDDEDENNDDDDVNDDDEDSPPTTPPPKRRYVRKSNAKKDRTSTVYGQTTNGSSVSYQSRTPTSTNDTSLVNGNSTGKKRGRPRLNKPSVITNNNGDNQTTETTSTSSPSVTSKISTQKKSITKPKAFMNKSNPVSSLNNILVGQHHRFDTRIGFLSPFEEQEIFDAIDQLRSKNTFEEAEQMAKRRFEHILCLNLNKTNVDIPQEWFYSFLFAHPILIVKNAHWFNDKNSSDNLTDNELLNDVNRTQSSTSLQVLKHQLGILAKLYRNELQVRQSNNNKQDNV